jgi:lipoprotein-releasing system permease protein
MDSIAILKATGFLVTTNGFYIIVDNYWFDRRCFWIGFRVCFSSIIDAIPFETTSLPTIKTSIDLQYSVLQYRHNFALLRQLFQVCSSFKSK